MPSSGESRTAQRIAIVAFVLAVVGGLWWWSRGRASDHPATSTVTQPQRGAPAAAAAPRAAVAPAALAVTVSDDRGPLADAAVRFAPRDGEVVVVRTGADGVARADRLQPGAWTVSASAADHVPA